MSQVNALGKRPCPDCGGELEWNAGKQLLMCPYCGFIPKDQPTRGEAGGGVREHPLERALNEVGDEDRGYGMPTVQVKCQSCQAISVFEHGRVAQRCDFCGSPSVVPYADTRDPITPESVLPARLDNGQIRDLLRKWYGSSWLAPNALKDKALTDTLHGIYLPYWTFDSRVAARWAAESGDYYYETVMVKDAQGRSVARQVQKIRWTPAAGALQHFFDDELVPGTVGVRVDLLRQVEPFPTKDLAPYDPAYVRGWTVERYQIDLRKAADIGKSQMDEQTVDMAARQVPGDTHRNLRVDAKHSGRTFKHILVPIWLVTYDFGPKGYQVLVNGYTGKVTGDRPVSPWKVFFYIILPILIVLLVFLLSQGGGGRPAW